MKNKVDFAVESTGEFLRETRDNLKIEGKMFRNIILTIISIICILISFFLLSFGMFTLILISACIIYLVRKFRYVLFEKIGYINTIYFSKDMI